MGSLRPDVGRLIAFPASGREPRQTKRQLAAYLQVSEKTVERSPGCRVSAEAGAGRSASRFASANPG